MMTTMTMTMTNVEFYSTKPYSKPTLILFTLILPSMYLSPPPVPPPPLSLPPVALPVAPTDTVGPTTYAVAFGLTLLDDDATRAEGVTLLPQGKKWLALALECIDVSSIGLNLRSSSDDEPSREEMAMVWHASHLSCLLRMPSFSCDPSSLFISLPFHIPPLISLPPSLPPSSLPPSLPCCAGTDDP